MYKWIAAFAFLFSCSQPQDPHKKVVQLAIKDDVKNADSTQIFDQVSAEFAAHIFEGLMGYVYDGSENHVAPRLAAQEPKISSGGKIYTFELRKDLRFQDSEVFEGGKGRIVRSSDFVYTIKRLADPRTGSSNWWSFDGMIDGLNSWRNAIEKAPDNKTRDRLFENPVAGLSAPNPTTLVLKLTKAYPQLRFILSMPHAAPVAFEAVKFYGPDIINHPVGTGPFKLKEWIRGSQIVVERNANFREVIFRGRKIPSLDEIRFEIIKEEQPAWLKFLSQKLDESLIPKDSFSDAIDASGEISPKLKEKNIALYKNQSLTTWWLEFNLKDPILGKSLKLRQALACAFDRARALSLLYNNRGLLSDGPLPPSIEGSNMAPPYPYNYNLERAKTLLSEAGYPNGKGLPDFSFDLRGPSTTNRQLGELVRDNFQKIGVHLNIIANSFPEAVEKQKRARYQIMLGGWMGDYPDPENFMQLFYSPNFAPGSNSSNFKNAQYDALYNQIRTQLPGSKRAAVVGQMVQILQKEAAVAFFYHQVDYKLVQSWVLDYIPKLMPMGPTQYWDLKAH
jgi:oligopeptide transport system substrate-binding protein